MTRKIARYGWRPSLPDPRDRIYNMEETILPETALPLLIDLEPEMPDIYNQLRIGTCVPHGAIGIAEHCEMREGEGPLMLSRLFVYYEGRKAEGSPVDQDTGMEVRTAIKILVSEGAPPESDWPYSDADPGPFQQQPPPQAYTDAVKHEALVYRSIVVNSPGAPMRTALFNHLPIVFGFAVPDYFEDPSWDPAATPLPLPDASTNFIGGHCVVKVGYDWTCKRFPIPVWKIRNSWGPDWGDNGHFYMPYNADDPWRNFASDFWVISKVK